MKRKPDRLRITLGGMLRAIFASFLIYVGLGSAATAVPVTFTYTSNAVDLSVLEEWKYRYLEFSDWDPAHLQGRQAQISMEVDCDISSSSINCAQLLPGSPSRFLSLSTSDYAPLGFPVKLVSEAGFTDDIRLGAFQVDTNGKVTVWSFQGAEYGQVGDFWLSNAGDRWDYAGWVSSSNHARCYFAFGLEYDRSTGLCENGASPPDPALDLQLGVGTWTAHLADGTPLPDVPLPAGLPLVFSGIGAMALLRRRARRRSAT